MLDVFIHFQASPAIGMGHAVRCLNLAEECSRLGCQIYLLLSAQTQRLVLNRLKDDYIVVPFAPQTPISLEGIGSHSKKIAIIDNYDLNENFSRYMRRFVSRILIIDDLADRKHDCDFLLDQTVGSIASRYDNLTPENCQFLLGPQYALLDPVYAQTRPQKLKTIDSASKHPKRIMINMGGSDPNNITCQILNCLEKHDIIKSIEIVVGGSNPHTKQIQEAAEQNPNQVSLHQNLQNLAGLLAQCDLAIGAGGVSALERCVVGMPSLLIEIANNQRFMIEELCRAGAALSLGRPAQLTPMHLTQNLQQMVQPKQYQTMCHNAAQLCDGMGANRVAHILTQEDIRKPS